MKCHFSCGACGLKNEFEPRPAEEMRREAKEKGTPPCDAYLLRCACGVLNQVVLPGPIIGAFLKEPAESPVRLTRHNLGTELSPEKGTSPTLYTFPSAGPCLWSLLIAILGGAALALSLAEAARRLLPP